MNTAQTHLYFREWGKVRDHYRAKGIDPKLCDAKRHELHEKALGQKKSSKDFTNADLDKVLAAFWAITKPADLNAQLRQLDQDENRAKRALDRAHDLAIGVADVGRENNYIRGIAQKLFGEDQIHFMDYMKLEQICGVLARRRKQLETQRQRANKQAVGALATPKNGDPF